MLMVNRAIFMITRCGEEHLTAEDMSALSSSTGTGVRFRSKKVKRSFITRSR